jgi:hypothetical protein
MVAGLSCQGELGFGRQTGRALAVLSAAILLVVGVCLALTWTFGQRPARATASPAASAAVPTQPDELDPVLLGSQAELIARNVRRQLGESSAGVRGGRLSGASASEGSQVTAVVPAVGPQLVGGTGVMSASADAGSQVARAAQQPASPGATSQPAVQPARSEAARFSLGGIIRIGGQWMANINGKLVRAGESVDGGTVLQIESQTVEMQSSGERFTLRM